jgi:hypothetical protein
VPVDVLSKIFFFWDVTHYKRKLDTYTHTSIHLYEYTHVHPNHMNTSKKLDRLDLEIHEVGQRVSYCRWGRHLALKE